jgi:hypothetical protein
MPPSTADTHSPHAPPAVVALAMYEEPIKRTASAPAAVSAFDPQSRLHFKLPRTS